MAKKKRLGTAELLKEVEEIRDELAQAYEVPVAEELLETYNTVRLVNNINARVRMEGSVSGKRYEWSKAGAVVEVDERDAPALLQKRLGNKTCCGSSNQNVIFGIVNLEV